MGNDCYVYCLGHRETLHADKWAKICEPPELAPDGVIADKDQYAARLLEMEIKEQGADWPEFRDWRPREWVLLSAFLRRHSRCKVRVAMTYGPKAWLEAFFAARGPLESGTTFSFYDDGEWNEERPGPALGDSDVAQAMGLGDFADDPATL